MRFVVAHFYHSLPTPTYGLTLESLTAFPSFEQPAYETTWNVLGVAKAQ